MSDSESLYESSSHEEEEVEEERGEEEDGVNFANIKKTFTNDVVSIITFHIALITPSSCDSLSTRLP
jgi:cytochrome b